MNSLNVRTNARTVAVIIGVIVLAVIAVIIPNYLTAYSLFIITEVAIYAIACMGLTVIIGWSGQVALAQAGFFGVGAYGAAYLSAHGIAWFAAVMITALASAAIGILIGLPTTRLRGFYFAIATLAFGDLMDQIFNSWTAFSGGPIGMQVNLLTLGSISPARSLWYVSAVILALTLLILWHLGRTRWGRCLRAVRDLEIATGSLGLSATKYKVQAFAVSAILGAIAGSLYGQELNYIEPSSFTSNLTIEFLIVALVGGVDRLAGAVVGATFLVVIQEQLQSFGAYQRLLFGAVLVIIVRFMPSGVLALVYSWVRRLFSNRSTAEADEIEDVAAVTGGAV